jgi:hypothetical protein
MSNQPIRTTNRPVLAQEVLLGGILGFLMRLLRWLLSFAMPDAEP